MNYSCIWKISNCRQNILVLMKTRIGVDITVYGSQWWNMYKSDLKNSRLLAELTENIKGFKNAKY